MASRERPTEHRSVIESEDVVRWLTFGGFWGFVFYLLSCMGLILSHRRQPVKVHGETVLVGMGIHVGSFVGFTSIISIVQAVLSGKSSTQNSRERISGGALEQSVLPLAIGGGAGSVLPFLAAVASLRAAEQLTGEPAFQDPADIRWLRAAGTNALLSMVAALAVARITSWVARDARAVLPPPEDT